MSDSNDSKTVEELKEQDYIHKLEQKNKALEDSLISIKKYYQEYDQFAFRINPPGQSYKELEEKIKNLENEKEKTLQDLWNNQIIPLQNELAIVNTRNAELVSKNLFQDSNIKRLGGIIKHLNTGLDFAVGYISAHQESKEKFHPLGIKQWILKGIDNSQSYCCTTELKNE